MMSKSIERFLALAERMQASAEGLGISDIENIFDISRRTAERLRDDVAAQFPYAYEEVETGEKTKRWRLRTGTTKQFFSLKPEELTELQNAISLFKKSNMHEQAEHLIGLSTKIQSMIRPEKLRSLTMDMEDLLLAEGFAMRPGPRPKIAFEIVKDLRQAMLHQSIIELSYKVASSGNIVTQAMHPYGFLYGNRHYLVAFNPDKGIQDFRMFRLSNIISVKVTEKSFQRDLSFSLEKYAQNSFGVFQEEPFDVVWHFNSDAAPDAAEYEFHPSQTMEWQDDGSLIVRFRAGGRREMDWHLYTWGDSVKDLTEYHSQTELTPS
jgi:predicted DNA-binding transcriptional regulator YafY